MIRINLIQRPVAPAEEQQKISDAPSLQTAHLKVLGGAAGAVFILVGLSYAYWNHQVNHLRQSLAMEKAQAARLAAIQTENQRYQAQLNQIRGRIQVIQGLQAARTGPKELMTQLADSVNRTKGLYLLTVDGSSGRIVMHGESDLVNSIADFLTALQQAGTFSDVHLRQLFEDDQNERASYKFDLDCLYKPTAPTPAPAGGLASVQALPAAGHSASAPAPGRPAAR